MRRRLAWGLSLLVCGFSAADTIRAQVKPAATAAAKAATPPTTPPVRAPKASARLPIKRVILYKNGVGYFEHLGEVTGNETVSIDFTSAQLNDALKSLTTLDLGDGRIAGISYNSRAPLGRQLDALRLPLSEKTTRAALFDALRGARVTVHGRGGTAVTGRILSFEHRTRDRGTASPSASAPGPDTDDLVIVSDDGAVHTTDLDNGVSVSLVEPDLRQQVGSYLDLLSAARAPDLRRVLISTVGTKARPLFVSYISEVPVWKTTYRIVLPSAPAGKPLLQGWAIIDNTVGEDWTNVELSLVAGAPQSFVQQLSQPYYGKRPVVPLPPGVSRTPQTHDSALLRDGEGTLTGRVSDTQGAALPGASIKATHESGTVFEVASDANGAYRLEHLPVGTYRVDIGLTGFSTYVATGVEIDPDSAATRSAQLAVGGVTEAVAVVAETPTLQTSTSSLRMRNGAPRGMPAQPKEEPSLEDNADAVAAGLAAGVATQANTRDLGDLFEYHLKEHVTIRKNESALVPIVSSDLGAEKVSLWRERDNESRPLRALWLTNSSGLTLDGGSFMVIEGETFAGEGLIDAMKPGERRLVSYAADLGVVVAKQADNAPRRVTRTRIEHGILTQFREERQRVTFTARNEDATPRDVIVEHPVSSAWRLASGPQPEETTPTARRFRLRVAAKSSASLSIEEVHPFESRVELDNTSLDDKQIALILSGPALTPEAQQQLQAIRARKDEAATIASAIQMHEGERSRIEKDQERVRENLKSLQSANTDRSLVERYARQLATQEDRLQVLQREQDDLESRQNAKADEIDRLLKALVIDVR